MIYKVVKTSIATQEKYIYAPSEAEALDIAEDCDWKETFNVEDQPLHIEEADPSALSHRLIDFGEEAHVYGSEMFLSKATRHEGWGIFHTIRGLNEGYTINKVDEDDVFEFDTEAIMHVVTMALLGDGIEREAIKFLHRVCPDEIEAWKYGILHPKMHKALMNLLS